MKINTINRYTLGLLSLAAVALTSCNDELAEINANPNASENPQPAYLLSAAQYYGANLYQNGTTGYNSTLLWVQHWAKIQYTEPDRYDVTNSSFDDTWNTTYAYTLADLKSIQESEAATDNEKAAAKVWGAWNFLLLTELFGDVPYTQFAASTTPAYDSQETIFSGILAELEDAAKVLATSKTVINGDGIYGGDAAKWSKFAQSLRLRIALLIADRDEAKAKSIIQALSTNLSSLISSNDDNATFVFDSSNSSYWNPWGSAFYSRDDQRVSKTLVDKLTELNDPRLPIFAQPAEETGLYAGGQNGLTADAANNQGFSKLSKPGKKFLAYDAPAVLFTYSEVLFALAESAARGFINAPAAVYYEQAIAASLKQHGVSDADVTAYLAQPAVAYSAAPWYVQIGTQKWISLYGQAPDAYTDWRRLGYPELTPGPNTALAPGETPRRFFYPSTESGQNQDSYRAAVANQGADLLTTRLWFDVASKKR